MRKKRIRKAAALALWAALALGLWACGGRTEQTASTAQTEAVEQTASTVRTASSVQAAPPVTAVREDASETVDGMALCQSSSFFHEEEEWDLQLWAQEDMVIDGELAMDDSCRFLIRAVQGDGAYTLFDDQVQLGVPAGEAWMDVENRLHVVIRDARSAQYKITDFVFDGEREVFAGEIVMDWSGINYGWKVGGM